MFYHLILCPLTSHHHAICIIGFSKYPTSVLQIQPRAIHKRHYDLPFVKKFYLYGQRLVLGKKSVYIKMS